MAIALCTLLFLLVAATGFVAWTVQRSFPSTDGELTLAGLDAEVRVLRDSAGVPQIYADTADDLFFAQGFVQAQDRFFEMDFRRHVTAGRLSELFGGQSLETDMFVRTLGWRRVAEQELELLSARTRRHLEAFSAGVNAYLADHEGAQLSLEYAVLSLNGLDYTAEPWTPVDSLSWLKAMAWDLRGNMEDEINRVIASTELSKRRVARLYPPYPYRRHAPIVEEGAVVDKVYEQVVRPGRAGMSGPASLPAGAVAQLAGLRAAARDLPALLGTGDGVGSNAWAVAGDRTSTGKPLLANDPHLDPSMPGVWYQMGLHCTTVSRRCPYDVAGFTFAGVPGVVIGHNHQIAWGFTNLEPDTTDLYLEKIRGESYRYDGRSVPLVTRRETFAVEGRDKPVTITVRSTRHGPLLSDVSDSIARIGAQAPVARDAAPGERHAVALRWTALDPGRTADALFGIDRATSWLEFRRAVRHFEVPAQNLVYADRAGHIGYQAPGRIPIRRTGHGNWPVPGWDPAYEWKNYVPFAALPNVLDPAKGYVVTANQAVVGRSYPYHLGDSWDYGFRSQRINDLLRTDRNVTIDDMASIQQDTRNANAATLVPYLLDVSLESAFARQGQRVLDGWDFTQPASSSPAAYFNVVWANLLALTFHDQLPKAVWPEGGDRWMEVVRRLVRDPDNRWWDDVTTSDVRETRDDVLARAMVDARDELTMRQARNPASWTWGHLHTLELVNASLGTSGVGPVEWLFNRGPYELGGGSAVVNATSWKASEGYQVTVAPGMRMVVSLGDLDDSRWVNLTGASGHAFSDHYTDQTDLWATGQTLPWPYTPDAVATAAADTLVLHPPD
jgi:penicillin amidase